MKISRWIVSIAICLLSGHVAMAQIEAKPLTLPESVMNAEMQSVDRSSPIRLAEHSGQVLILYTWASWCVPCRLASPVINDLHKDYAGRGVEVIGLAFGDPKTEAKETLLFSRELKHNFESGWLDEEMSKAVIGERQAIPQILVITIYGHIFKRFVGYSPEQTPRLLRETVEQALINPYLIQ